LSSRAKERPSTEGRFLSEIAMIDGQSKIHIDAFSFLSLSPPFIFYLLKVEPLP
jgi:hypothetical protein